MDLSSIAILILSSLFYTSTLFLIAAGLNLIYGVVKLVDLARASIFSIGAYMFAWSSTSMLAQYIVAGNIYIGFTLPLILSITLAVAVSLLLKPFYKLIYGRAEETQLLATFGLILIFEDIIKAVWGPLPLTAPETYRMFGSIEIGGYRYPQYNIVVIAIGMATAVGMWIAIYRTKIGMLLRAMAMDPEMLRALGGNIDRLLIATLAIAGALSGLGGALYLPAASAYLGLSVEILILALVVIIIGGLGSFIGTLIGALIVGAVRTAALQIFPELELAVLYIIALVILLAKPEGIGSIWER
jgi:branched-chain amino acid transport system permease protein